MPYDGSTNDGDWVGFIPFEELPNLYNPPGGLIVTANQRTVGASYKYTQFIRDAAAPWRARRIFDRLSSKPKITMDDVRDTQLDVFNIPLDNLAKQIVKLNAASPETLSVLKAWDGRMTPDSQGALLSNEIRRLHGKCDRGREQAGSGLRYPRRIVDKAVTRAIPFVAAEEIFELQRLYVGLRRKRSGFTGRSKAVRSRFGKLGLGQSLEIELFSPARRAHRLIGQQFVIPSVPIAGSGQTPNVGSSVSMRFIASPGNWDATRHVIPLGESGDPKSPFYKDQFHGVAEREHRRSFRSVGQRSKKRRQM